MANLSFNVLIQGLAHEGVLKNPDKFGQGNYKEAYGQIHWWLKRRWARLAVITAIETRYAGLGHAGGSAQQQAAAFHAQAQAQDDWREDGAPASSSVCSLVTLFSEKRKKKTPMCSSAGLPTESLITPPSLSLSLSLSPENPERKYMCTFVKLEGVLSGAFSQRSGALQRIIFRYAFDTNNMRKADARAHPAADEANPK